MKKVFAVTAAIALLCLGNIAQAVVMDTVPVGDPGNAADSHGAGYGSVGYNYDIGKYEVTAGQYTDFLNAVAKTDTYLLWNFNMWTNYDYGCKILRLGSSGSYIYSVDPSWANRPVNFVSYWDACRFANWLHNGQPTGLQNASTTEDGAYYIDGYLWDEGETIQRKAGAKWAVTSEDEWYKAAYYKGGGTNEGYWDYPTGSDTEPSNRLVEPIDPGNNATYVKLTYTIGKPYYRTLVGAHENSESPYGTFDQAGNVSEWNEEIVSHYPGGSANRGVRGGSFISESGLAASQRGACYPSYEDYNIGFRVSAVPEPSSLLALGSGVLALAGMIRRRNG